MTRKTTPQMTQHAGAALLDPLRFPLRGSRLIEASAGTGKTFTIAALYLRLVLGHGGEAAFDRPLTPPEILVVTFTEAATKELRDRIRARLAEAADAFLVDPKDVVSGPPGEDLLYDLRAQYEPREWAACARRLRLAAEWMDESAVSTIHGWCNRMLGEHAFDSGSLFTQTLETDQGPLQQEALRDYWRSHAAPLDASNARAFYAWWKTPDALWESIEDLLPVRTALSPGAAPAECIAQAQEERARLLEELKAPWRGEDGWAMALFAGLEKAVAERQCKMPRRRDWMHKLRAWAEGDAIGTGLTDTARAQLNRDFLRTGWSGDEVLLDHPAWPSLEALHGAIDGLPDGRLEALRHAVHGVAERMAAEQSRRALMGFDDLLTRLDAGLCGPNGQRLSGLIRQQFPVALIDEFQDTDPIQYRIFDRIYGVADDRQDTALVLIGDPKQAIYAFRGADIHTYLHARADTLGRHATLGRNFRSTSGMVDAVNRVFQLAEERSEGAGAFLFRRDGDNRLPFQPMAARGRGEHWQRQGRTQAALTLWAWDEEGGDGGAGDEPGKDEMRRRGAEACAGRIAAMLREGQDGRSGFVDAKGRMTGARASDIAVLVNDGNEADAVRQALARLGVRSVYLSDKGSVFESPMAADLQRLLGACADPDDGRSLHAALGCSLLGLAWHELERLNHDEVRREALLLQFRGYQQLWARQGVLPMLRHLLDDFKVPQRLRAEQDERGLTDLLHLCELLQLASARLDGQHALIRWFAQQQLDGADDQDERKLRLESDEALVKVVTIHKSKGLEYPLVFLPFATSFFATKPTFIPFKWNDPVHGRQVALQATPEILEAVDRERLGEDLRKLYVALTRARHATWVGVAPVGDVHRSALGYLLGGGRPLSGKALAEALRDLAAGCTAIAIEPMPGRGEEPFIAQVVPTAPRPPLPLPADLRDTWWITSYSALNRTGTFDMGIAASPPPAPDSAARDIFGESLHEAGGLVDARPGRQGTVPVSGLHGFPRGAAAGSFLHGLLEWAGRQGFDRVRSDATVQAELADLVARRCNLRGWQAWIEPLRVWVLHWVGTPLRLGGVPPGAEETPVLPAALKSYQIEMEFWLAICDAGTEALDALVCRHILGGAPRAPLLPRQVDGMLKGFIDLVFEHEGRYYVADYKSNHLGRDDAAYTAEAMRGAVLAHRYDLQYALYVYALHRLLRTRLADYDYDRHMGGAVYLFLRGSQAPSQGLHFERPARALVDGIDALFEGGTGRGAGTSARAAHRTGAP